MGPQEMGRLLARSLEVLEGKLSAQETKFFTYQGEVLEERQVEDHKIQMTAATELAKLVTGVASLRGSSEGASNLSGKPVAIQINLNAEKPEKEETPSGDNG